MQKINDEKKICSQKDCNATMMPRRIKAGIKKNQTMNCIRVNRCN